jgi:hypothetical protein
MKRSIALALSLALAGTASAHAQSAKPAAVADSTKKKFVGTWEGSYYSDHAPENALKLVIAHDTAWTATMDVTADHPVPTLQAHAIKVAGNTMTWTVDLMGGTCATSGVLLAGTLKGEIKCGDGSIGFLLHKRS